MTKGGPRFRYYRGGISLIITPVNAAGWIALIIWTAVLIPLLIGFEWAVRIFDDPIYTGAAIALLVIGNLVWIVGGIRWMLDRSERIDADKLRDRKRERESNRRSG